MHTLSPCEGPVESIFNFIQSPLGVLCPMCLSFCKLYVDLSNSLGAIPINDVRFFGVILTPTLPYLPFFFYAKGIFDREIFVRSLE